VVAALLRHDTQLRFSRQIIVRDFLSGGLYHTRQIASSLLSGRMRIAVGNSRWLSHGLLQRKRKALYLQGFPNDLHALLNPATVCLSATRPIRTGRTRCPQRTAQRSTARAASPLGTPRRRTLVKTGRLPSVKPDTPTPPSHSDWATVQHRAHRKPAVPLAAVRVR